LKAALVADETGDFRVFPKTWGAEFTGTGEVRFRIWAPDLDELSLSLDDAASPMSRNGEGWFELLATGVAPGARYGFVMPDGLIVPDPASRTQNGDVHARSLVVDPTAFRWRNAGRRGREWREVVIYELHVGTFTPEGTFEAATKRLDHLAGLGVTCVELMPVGQFSGRRGWGYDGVLPYAPHTAYGSPDDMKRFIDEAHGLGLMVLLDVVYNHFGPDGNYLPLYAGKFFDRERHTPWGAAIAYDRAPVRKFFIENALYWLEEFNLDGLRLDAVDQIKDASDPQLLIEIAQEVRKEFPDRHVHLTTEDNRNIVHLHGREDGHVPLYDGEWNDDFHNAAHVLLTGEDEGYYEDFADDSLGKLIRCLAQGFAFQGEPSVHAEGQPRGEPSSHLPPTAFVDFLQNHDQVGNRAFGERLASLTPAARIEALTAVLLLSPHIPLLFMGEEWGETRPFCFFTDYAGELAQAVRKGRRSEFAHFSAFKDGEADTAQIPDPNDVETFANSKLDWKKLDREDGAKRLSFFKELLALRSRHIVPLLSEGDQYCGCIVARKGNAFAIDWAMSGGLLQLRANLGEEPSSVAKADGEVVFTNAESPSSEAGEVELQRWSVIVAVRK
jgi:maltooligosyltrehalose trehalohydrolase